MTMAEQLAAFVVRASYEDLSPAARQQLKARVLDALGCAIGALAGEPVWLVRQQIEEFGGAERCTLIGGGHTASDRAAFYNSALVRYLDFNDSYLAVGETCHPSDNLGAVLAAAEYAGCSGRELLTALAVAYQVHCRLSEAAPVRAKGFDHTTQGSYAVAAGVSKALGLDQLRTAHTLALSGAAFNALRVTRTGALSHWKGLAYPNTAFGCLHAAFLARRGVTGPLAVFEGNKGLIETITRPFTIDWAQEDLERVTRTIIKAYNAEVHAQSAIEGILELRREHHFTPDAITRITVEIFEVAFHIIGGGEEGEKTRVSTKEEADHSLPYLIAVALRDGQVLPEQYQPECIRHTDVQTLLQKVTVRPLAAYSQRFPDEMPRRLTVVLNDGRTLAKEKRDYEGFHTRPMRWDTVVRKFERRSAPYTDAALRRHIIEVVAQLEIQSVADLMRLLAHVQLPNTRAPQTAQHDERNCTMAYSDTQGHHRAFAFLRTNARPPKPRERGVTEIRGPYYTPMGKRYLQDVLETMGAYVDTLKFAGGSFSLMPAQVVKELIDLCHQYDVQVSTGGFLERVLTQGAAAVERYIQECKELGFDIIEISCGFITIPTEDWVRLINKVQQAGLKAKPEVGIQFGAGGATGVAELEAEGTRDPAWAIMQAQQFLEVGASMIMIESEGITENVREWRTDVVAKIVGALGLERVMFEAAEPDVFAWYIKNYGPEVNLFVDHSQIVQLECLRSGIWGTKSLWGRIFTYKDDTP